MTKIVLRFDKTVQENAAIYYEKSKKAKKKLGGLQKAIVNMEKKIKKAEQSKIEVKEVTQLKKKRSKKWFEKFHWFYSSDKFLVICGRDAKSNESLVKKHMEKTDLYFHAEIYGAPHAIIKTEKKTPTKTTLTQAAQFAGIFSRAWKTKLATIDVYSVKPEQVSKSAPTGESIGTGAFMIYGKRNWFRKVSLEFILGADSDGRIISGPKSAVLKKVKVFLELVQGDEKKGAVAKTIKKQFEEKLGKNTDLDEIISMLPSGGIKILKK